MNNVICDQTKSLSGLKDRHNLFSYFFVLSSLFFIFQPVFVVLLLLYQYNITRLVTVEQPSICSDQEG